MRPSPLHEREQHGRQVLDDLHSGQRGQASGGCRKLHTGSWAGIRQPAGVQLLPCSAPRSLAAHLAARVVVGNGQHAAGAQQPPALLDLRGGMRPAGQAAVSVAQKAGAPACTARCFMLLLAQLRTFKRRQSCPASSPVLTRLSITQEGHSCVTNCTATRSNEASGSRVSSMSPCT